MRVVSYLVSEWATLAYCVLFIIVVGGRAWGPLTRLKNYSIFVGDATSHLPAVGTALPSTSPFKANKALGNLWTRFWNRSDAAPQGNLRVVYEPLEHFFNLHSLANSADIDLRKLRAMPDMIVGWGLFITFTLLVVAVALLAAGAGSESADQAGTRVAELMGTAGTKFAISAVAVLCSLVVRQRLLSAERSVNKALDAFIAALEPNITLMTRERVLIRELQQAAADFDQKVRKSGEAFAGMVSNPASSQTYSQNAAQAFFDKVADATTGAGATFANTVDTSAAKFAGLVSNPTRNTAYTTNAAQAFFDQVANQTTGAGAVFTTTVNDSAEKFAGLVSNPTSNTAYTTNAAQAFFAMVADANAGAGVTFAKTVDTSAAKFAGLVSNPTSNTAYTTNAAQAFFDQVAKQKTGAGPAFHDSVNRSADAFAAKVSGGRHTVGQPSAADAFVSTVSNAGNNINTLSQNLKDFAGQLTALSQSLDRCCGNQLAELTTKLDEIAKATKDAGSSSREHAEH